MNNIIDHVRRIPNVERFLKDLNGSKIAGLFDANMDAFENAPAAAKNHHNFTHGLLIHTAEVWETTNLFTESAQGLRYDRQPGYSNDELLTAVALHDFAKIVQYEPIGNHAWGYRKMVCNQEAWTLRELARHGIELTDNELVGLLHAEGGYTKFEVEWRPMSVIVHAADLWSSQAMATTWNPADEMGVICPKCGSGMAPRNGARGPFFGCTKYPACNGIVNVENAPTADEAFGEFVRNNYPLTGNTIGIT